MIMMLLRVSSFFGSEVIVLLLALLLAVLVGAMCHIKPAMPIYVALFLAASSSMMQELSFSVGATQVSLSGLLWLGLIFIMLLQVLIRRKIYSSGYVWFFALFVIWVGIRLIIGPYGFVGVKDMVWYAAPLVVILHVSSLKSFLGEKVEKRLNRLEMMFVITMVMIVLIFVVVLLTGVAQYTAGGPRGEFIGSSRGVVLYLLLVLAVVVSSWRYGPYKKRGKFFSILTLVAILLTLGRIASFLAILFIVVKWINPGQIWKIILAGVVSLLMFYAVVYNVPVLKQRFFFTDNWEFDQGMRGVNTAGRNVMWAATYESAIQEPIIGKGLGSTRKYLTSIIKNRGITEQHPHNEYLQVFHDTGFIGVVLLLLAWGSLLLAQWRNWRKAQTAQAAKWSMASFMAVVAVLLSSITDNPMHYPFVVIPCAILCGISRVVSLNSRRHSWTQEGIST